MQPFHSLLMTVIAGALLVPGLASAQATAVAASFVNTFNQVILFPTIALMSAVALLVFLYGCFEYIALSGNDAAREKGVRHITWGIIGLVVMISAYAILSIVVATFGLQDELDTARDGGQVFPIPSGGGSASNNDGSSGSNSPTPSAGN